MVTQYITTRPVLDLCERATWRPGARVSQLPYFFCHGCFPVITLATLDLKAIQGLLRPLSEDPRLCPKE